MNLVKLPSRFIAYMSKDKDDAEPYTVVYPDGAVFLFEADDDPRCRFLCSFPNFSARKEDKLIKLVPKHILDKILMMEV